MTENNRQDQYKSTNTKRWIALGLAILLLIISSISSGITSNLFKSKEEDTENFFTSLFQKNNQMTETSLQGSDKDNRILLVPIEGVISSNRGSSLLSSGTDYNQDLILASLDSAKDDESIKGIILEVDSPGGGVYESAQVYDKVMEVKKARKIPVIAVMKSMAASGGYYISCASDKIYASQETITGSIGVIMSSLNMSGLFDKLGIQNQTIKSAAHKDIGSTSRPMTEEEKAILQNYINSAYGRFVDIVAKGRKMTKDQVLPLADGRIYDGVQAKAAGLVDEIAYPDQAYAAFEKQLGHEDMEIFTHSTGLSLDSLAYPFMKGQSKEEVLAKELEKGLASPKASYLYGGGF